MLAYPRCLQPRRGARTADELDTFAERTLRELRGLAPFQRDAAIERILRADRELRPWLPEIVAIYQRKAARRLPPALPG